ncbi:MAG: 4,5-DOPA-extradiol-dioxygenase [Bacteriovorax sp.]
MNQENLKPLPVLFIGHGSPMNALAHNDYTKALENLGRKIPTPKAVLCISAHWMTEGTWITGMERPKTIHDFYGFPQELFDVRYPAPGAPLLAREISDRYKNPSIHNDLEMWGLDHGTWSVLRHLYPKADIPVMQLSLYMSQSPEYHFKLGEGLRELRHQGVLIIGSGNIVHNLRKLDWSNENARPHAWALEFDEWVKEKINQRDFLALQKEITATEAGKLSVPTYDHYYPLLYILGASRPEDSLHFEYEGIQNASISMRCVSFGLS